MALFKCFSKLVFFGIEGLLESFAFAASLTNNYGNLALHFTAWKKGPLDCLRLLLQASARCPDCLRRARIAYSRVVASTLVERAE